VRIGVKIAPAIYARKRGVKTKQENAKTRQENAKTGHGYEDKARKREFRAWLRKIKAKKPQMMIVIMVVMFQYNN